MFELFNISRSLDVLGRKQTDTKTAIISKRITRFCKLLYKNYILLVFTYVERDNVDQIHSKVQFGPQHLLTKHERNRLRDVVL